MVKQIILVNFYFISCPTDFILYPTNLILVSNELILGSTGVILQYLHLMFLSTELILSYQNDYF